MNKHFLYFAYGSNMSLRRISARVSSIEKVSIAYLSGYQLKFHKVSKKDGSGKCDVVDSGNYQDKVYGVLYKIRADELSELDRFEANGYGYKRQNTFVTTDSGENLEAEIYIATNIDPNIRPYYWYKEHVVRGAKENELPETYISMLNEVVCEIDPDTERQATELVIYG